MSTLQIKEPTINSWSSEHYVLRRALTHTYRTAPKWQDRLYAQQSYNKLYLEPNGLIPMTVDGYAIKQARRFADSVGIECRDSLDRCLARLGRHSCIGRQLGTGTVRIHLMQDRPDSHDFYFLVDKGEGSHKLNGGIIYHKHSKIFGTHT